ncbi:MAG: S-layer homology domain-containing protein [Dialister invisus]|uniref:S-layer homology domain-containing protein n=1 Tax=Dialister invisus TaxID=218538 RepID=UPI0039963B5D
MNQIYKVIWSRVKHCYVVVSEVAGRCGKNGGATSEKKSLSFRAFLCALALTGCLLPGMAEASFKGGNGAVVDPNNSIAVGDDAQTAGQYTVALGSRTRATNIYAIAIGDQAKATGQGATAIGSLSLASALHSLAVGDQAHATGQDSSAYGLLSDATGVGSVALGTVAKAHNNNAIAIGNTSTVTGLNAIGIGSLANAAGTQTVVVGRQAHSDAASENSVAIGQGAHAGGQKRVGEQYSASTIAIGNIAYAAENGDVVIGRQATSTVSKYHGEDGSGAVVMGSEAHSYGSRGDVVLGSGAEANIIRKGTTDPAATPIYSQSIAIGSMAKVYGTQAMAIGGDVKSIGHSSIAIGGNDVDLVKSDLQAAVPGFWAAGAQNKFERETAALYPGTTLGNAALSTSEYRSNTASIGAASIAMGAMTQSFGIGSTAIGVNSMSKGAASTSIGVIARSWGKNSLAIGSQAGAYGDKSTSLGDTNMVGFDMTDGTTSGAASSAIGTDNKVYGNNSYVIGGGNTIGSATITETTEANGDKIKKVTAGTVKGSTAGAFGYKNTVTTDNAYVVGNNSAASADGAMVLGSSASVTGKNGVALGNNTKVANENAVAIGNGSETAAAVATPSATINGVTHNFAGVNPASTVSVGKAGAERTITNVAAGRISATSTDAINGSQLYAVTSEVDKGVAYAGDVKAAAAAANKFTRKLGEQTNIIGGVTDTSKLTDGNIGVVSNGTDTLNIKLAKDVKVDSVTAGNTVINNNGLTVGGNTYVTNNGINANNAPITNVASGGTIDSNAANIGDVKKAAAGAKATVTGAKQATVTSTVDVADGHTDYVVSATKTTLAAEAGGKVSVTGGTEDANGVIAYTVGLDAATKTAINNIGGGTIAAGDNKTVTGDTVNTYLNNNYYDKPTMDTKLGDKANTNLDNITNAGKTVINDIAADAVKVVNGKNTTVTPGTENGANGTVKTYAVNVSGNLTGITSISNQKTAPGGTTTGAKITLGDTTNTVNVGGAQINNVADGTAGTDAVNVNQLNDVKTLAGKHTTIKAKDANVTVTEGTNGDGGKEFTVGLGNVVTVGQTHPVTVNGDAGTVNGLTNTTWDIDNPQPVSGQAATEDQLKTVSDGVKTNKTNITKNANDITNINTTIGKGLNFKGDDATVINKKLGEQLEIKGGASADLTDRNIGVVSDGAKLNVKLKKDVDLGPNGSLTINGKTYVNKDGLNANNQKITNVATGTAGTDAVNVDQLNAAIGGTAKATTVKAKDANVTVTEGTNAAGGKEFTVGLGNVVTVGQTHPVTVNGDAGTVNGLTNTTWDIDNPQPVSGQAATEDQLKTVSDGVKTNKTNITKNANDITNINTTIGKGLNFKGDDATVINKKLGEQLDIKGGADASKLSDGNIGVVSGNGALNIKLAKDVKVDSVTTGNTVINNNGLTVGGKTYVTNNGINANNQKVTNVADGQVAAGSKDAVNGGQLHDAKNEVINKGLRFDADNNSEKTNKLGSKVTVNGDNNITTEITQTGDDTKIGVKLNEDIHVKTVTAADTVKAGGVTMGSQTSGGTTGNYVTGLDNKTWNVTNPTAVSGRAATEDQLKTVTEAINNQSAAATDYRLVQNASSADGSYTVDTNGNIDLTVEDKNHAGQKETVKLKDIASKSKLDDVIAKGLQFDANAGGTKTNKLGSKITVKGEGTAADTDYSGENLKTFITQDPAGNTTIDVKMNKNLKAETIVATGKDGKNGKIGINGNDGKTTNISVTRDGKPGVDGAAGTTTTRIVYEKPDGTKEEVATLNDGMKYGGDTGAVIKKKLNEQVNVVGGITDENKLTTENNLGVVSDGSDKLKVRLAKALKGLESITAGDTFINNNGITISSGAAGNIVSLTKNGLDNGGNKITNVADGTDPKDAVNKSQLDKATAAATTTVTAGKNITVTATDNLNGSKNYEVGLKDQVTLGTDPSKQVSIDGTTGIIKAGDKVTIDGTTGNIDAGKVKINGKDGTVNGLTNKTWDPNNITSGQAATEDQLKAVDQKITNTSEELTKKGMYFAGNDGEFHRNLGEKVTIKGEGTKDASQYSGENIKTFADGNGNLTVKMDRNLKADSLAINGQNGQDGAAIKGGTGKAGVDGTNITRLVIEEKNGTPHDIATLDDGMKYGGDTGNVIKKKLNEQVNVVGGITDTNKLTTEDNLGVVSDGNNNLKVRMAKDLKGLNSVTTNTLTVGDVKIDNSGINAGNKKITNVAAGDISANSTDAVNGGQLWKTNQTINNIGGAVNELGDRMDRVGAGAAALAALHPLDFDPDDKWDVAAGYGNYKDAHAVAVGAFYRPNEDTMFSVGGSFGGGENMVNAGVSVKLGQGNHVSTSKVAMAKEIVDLRDENKDLKKRLDTMEQKMNSILGILDMGKKKDFSDVPENHWAYEYVATLAGNGILEGYPDGMFSGDRTMTRYEFAAMFYRALKNGAPVDDNMDRAMNEFEPELRQIRLDRIRVDRISGKDNDRNKVERVRVNSEDDKAKNDYRDVYGSHISPKA